MKRINVGVLILSNTWGGAEESVYKIVKLLDKKKFAVHLFVNDFLNNNYKSLKGITLVNFGYLESNKKINKLLTLINIRTKLLKAIKNYNIDILHAQLENSLLVLGSIPKITIPLIFTLRGQETAIYHNPVTWEHKLIKRALTNILKNKNAKVTAVSNWLINNYNKKERERIILTVNGVDTKLYKPLKIAKSKNTILYVGRLIEKKGIEDLIKLADLMPDYEFLFVGKGPLSKIIKLKNTKYLGFKTREELVTIYNQATICCFPSRYSEGMPNVGLEAISCGACILASSFGFSDFIDNKVDGIIIEPRNLKKLKREIIKIMSNTSLRKKISRNARVKALKYDIRKTVKNYEVLYQETFRKVI